MKKFLIEETEKNKILSMHKALMNEEKISLEEQDAKGGINSQEDILRKSVQAGCLRNGRILTNADRSKFVYRATTKSGKEVEFLSDMTYKFRDGSKSGRWDCPQLANLEASQAAAQQTAQQTAADIESKIATEIKKGWKKLETLRQEGADLNTLDKVYDKQVIGNVTLYRPKGQSTTFTPNTSTSQFNQEQLDFVNKFEGLGYKLNPSRIEQSTMVKVSDKELGAPSDLFPNGLVMWYNPNTQSTITRNQDTVLGDILDNQDINKAACRKNIEDYFESFRRQAVADPATVNKAKKIVQACKGQYYGRWGVALQGNKLDNYLDILSGNKGGGPTSYGSDSIWRLR
jgi:hypothetical protein